MVGLGDEMVVRGLFEEDSAAWLFGDHLNVLRVERLVRSVSLRP